MPDADDFDVEYFRTLMQGNSTKQEPAPPAAPSASATKKTRQSPTKKTGARSAGAPKVARPKGK